MSCIASLSQVQMLSLFHSPSLLSNCLILFSLAPWCLPSHVVSYPSFHLTLIQIVIKIGDNASCNYHRGFPTRPLDILHDPDCGCGRAVHTLPVNAHSGSSFLQCSHFHHPFSLSKISWEMSLLDTDIQSRNYLDFLSLSPIMYIYSQISKILHFFAERYSRFSATVTRE